ncbi:hypothetical protein FJ941_25545 [Mesorhizobium sp. B2-3-13]|uniref:hypothetical protein n=1 Tax=Mesorhizobium sp. B2-3-13 TaxID=2589951 RepID=UPI00112ECE1F|nr:hypothetical protein [Mesorhizobium sp. B2-3-13]TPL76242.1 hypothetical protein FJ941_25545 [Mesorhizobium sp. B2-3-13]
MMSDQTTLRDLWESGRLKGAEEFLRQVWVRMRDCEKLYGPSCVRVGLKGSGASPNYRVRPIQKVEFPEPKDGQWLDETQYEYLALMNCAYGGLSHTRTHSGLGQETWSKIANTIDEVQRLRKEIIAKKRPSKTRSA